MRTGLPLWWFSADNPWYLSLKKLNDNLDDLVSIWDDVTWCGLVVIEASFTLHAFDDIPIRDFWIHRPLLGFCSISNTRKKWWIDLLHNWFPSNINAYACHNGNWEHWPKHFRWGYVQQLSRRVAVAVDVSRNASRTSTTLFLSFFLCFLSTRRD